MKKERGKILVIFVAVMLILSCMPSGMAFAEVTTPTPAIATPVYAGATSVSGTAPDSAGISLTVNSGAAQTATAGSGGSWTVSVPTLNANDNISVTALVYGDTVSQAESATVEAASAQTASAQTPTPFITTPIYAGATSVSGTAPDGASISLTVNGGTAGGTAQTTTAGPGGSWTVSVPALSANDSISVIAEMTGDTASQPATATVAAASAQTPTPLITTPYAGATSVSGTSADSAGISLTVNGGTAQTTTAGPTGNWTVSVPTLNENDSISVTAQVTGDTVSQAETATVEAASVQTPTPFITTPIYAGATSVSGTSADSAGISLTVNGGTAQTTTADSSGSWTVSGPTLNENDIISVTAQVTGDTVSQAESATVEAASAQTASVQTQTPFITTPIYAGATSVSGMSAYSAGISLTVNGGTAQTTTADSSGSWTVSVPALNANDSISVTAQVTGDTVSQAATATVEATSTAPVLSDVPTSYWAYDAISSLSSKGIVSGYPGGTFKPGASVTRAEFATMLVKALGLNTAGTTGQFTDVTGDSWCYGSVNAAVNAGLVSGTGNNLFAPNASITREQMAVMVAKALGTKAPTVDGTELNAFSDKSSVDSWAVTGMEEAVKAGIVSGMTAGTLAPNDNATRAEAAAMIYKLLTILGK